MNELHEYLAMLRDGSVHEIASSSFGAAEAFCKETFGPKFLKVEWSRKHTPESEKPVGLIPFKLWRRENVGNGAWNEVYTVVNFKSFAEAGKYIDDKRGPHDSPFEFFRLEQANFPKG